MSDSCQAFLSADQASFCLVGSLRGSKKQYIGRFIGISAITFCQIGISFCFSVILHISFQPSFLEE